MQQPSQPLPILYTFRRCPYAMRARMALVASQTRCEWRELVLRDKPPEMLAISPKGTVPVLQLTDGTVLEESLDIMRWSLAQCDPDGWLPTDEAQQHDVATLVEQNDGTFKRALDRYKYTSRYEGADRETERAKGLAVLESLERRLVQHVFLCGSQESFADIAIFPFIRQFANTDRAWFDAQALPALQAWLANYLDSPRFRTIMTKAKPWKAGDPVVEFPLSPKV